MDFLEYVIDQLNEVPNIHYRKMFSSFGMYSGDVFFAIISDGVLYFKTNKETKKKYVEYGMGPFTPSEKQILKNYMEVPEEILENREEVNNWALESIEIATM